MDAYYTNPVLAKEYCNMIKNKVDVDYNQDIIIEPSAGKGAFINPIKQMCKRHMFFDINPQHKEIIQQNYLTVDIPKMQNIRRMHVVGNPPFGKRASMAIQFIKKSCTFCDTFAFILPKSFEKASMKKTVPLNFHLIYSCPVEKDAFIFDNDIIDVPCVFQIWIKHTYARKKTVKPVAKGYNFVPNGMNADLAVRRVGYYAGKIYRESLQKLNINTHYFIKLHTISDTYRIHDMNLKNKKSVSGPYSISKQDIIKQLNYQLSIKPS